MSMFTNAAENLVADHRPLPTTREERGREIPLSAPDTTIATDTTLRVFLDISLQDAPHGDAGALIYVELSFREEGSGRIGWTGPSGLYAPGRYEVTGTAPGAISAPSMLIDVAYANAADPQSAALVQVQLGEIRSRAPCSP